MTQQNTCLVHVIHISRLDALPELLTHQGKPVHNLTVNIVIVPCSIQSFQCFSLQNRMTLVETLRPILARQMQVEIVRASTTSNDQRERSKGLDGQRISTFSII